MAKAVVLGASLCGVAAPFIEYARQSPEAVVGYIEGLKKQFSIAMFLMGVSSVADMAGNYALLRDE
jgi:isopentenyl-diphosphate delta-isomerase